MTSTSGTLAHMTRLDSIQSHSSITSQPPPHQQGRSNSVTQASQKVTQFATKLGQKLGHLRVKTHLSDPTSTGSLSHSLPVPPISPISPVSPTLPSPTKPYSETEAGTGTGGTIERNPASATPSFSSVSVPSLASNRHGQSMTRSEIPTAMPLLSSPSTCSLEKQFLPKSPPSPISPTLASATSPTSSSSMHHNPKFQKEHRSMLIKDLILQGEDALDEKEQALMAQYQPYRQQQLLLQQQQQQQQMKHQHPHQRQQKGPRRSSVATDLVREP
ncbi:hypothetical protein BGZ92_011584 [Podila epicladia]|nr:hypothetical protein BGZ92_011584 [Podila epicladia]